MNLNSGRFAISVAALCNHSWSVCFETDSSFGLASDLACYNA